MDLLILAPEEIAQRRLINGVGEASDIDEFAVVIQAPAQTFTEGHWINSLENGRSWRLSCRRIENQYLFLRLAGSSGWSRQRQ